MHRATAKAIDGRSATRDHVDPMVVLLFQCSQARAGQPQGHTKIYRIAVRSSSASPYNLDGTNRTALVGLIGWLGWAACIIIYSITLLRL